MTDEGMLAIMKLRKEMYVTRPAKTNVSAAQFMDSIHSKSICNKNNP